MSINQSKNKVFTKGLSDNEVAILAIVKRFFERNPEELYGSINNIVMEVLRRVKEELINGTLVASVSSVNGKIGQVELSATDVGAEPTIERLTAFNKDFGNEANTICEGNDPRLKDARQPLEHEHTQYIKEVDMDKAIEAFLKKKGIVFKDDGVTLSGNLHIKDGILTEGQNG